MPTYGYRCPKCGHEFEKFQKITDDTRAKCPECSTRADRLISGGAGVVFKGSGFYETDYKRAKAADAKTSDSDQKTSKETGKGADAPASDSGKDSSSSTSKPKKDDGS